MVANHTVVVLTPQIPNRQIAIGLLMQNHITNKLCCHIGAKQCIKGMSCTESVPQTEGTVVSLSLGHLLNLEVGIHVTSINIAHGIGLHQHMIHTSIEDSLLSIRSLDVYAGQFLLPCIVGCLSVVVEVPALCLGFHVLACTVIIDSRDRNLDHQVLTVLIIELEGSTQGTTVHYIALANRTTAIHQQTILNRLAKLGTEVNLTQLSPTCQHTEALDSVVINHAHLALDNLIGTTTRIVSITSPSHTVEVQDYSLLCCTLWEGVLMNTGMNSG